MRKIWLIVKREYITRVKTKGFVIGTLIVPLMGIFSVALVAFLVRHSEDQNVRMVIVDNAGGLAESTARSLNGAIANGKPEFTITESIERPASPDAVQQGLRARINSGALDAYLVIPGDLSQPFELHTRNPATSRFLDRLPPP
jgi:ABC-2 type transport system permease protein